MSLQITALGVPIPQGSTKAFMPRGARLPVVTADNARTKPWRQAIVDASREQMEGRRPIDGPVELRVVFYMPRPKSAPKRVTEPSAKPDLDKLVRAVGDALTAAGVWADDSRVVFVAARKVYAGGWRDRPDSRNYGLPRAVIEVREP